MKRVSIDLLDDDCWGLIFRRLEEYNYDLALASLACKRFLLLTNRAKTHLKVSNFTVDLLPSLLQRFRNLKSIEFRLTSPDPDGLITQISQSNLQHLESLKFEDVSYGMKSPQLKDLRELGIKMKGLKRLDLYGLYYLSDRSLIVLKDFFPCLEELNIAGWAGEGYLQVTDDGIKSLTSKLHGLKKIALESCREITDRSLMSLSSNCVDLVDVKITDCQYVTENGIGFLMRHSPKLTSLSILYPGKVFWQEESEFTFKNSIFYANSLEHLEFSQLTLSEDVLYSIAKASPPLKNFHYNNCGEGVTNGLVVLLKSCSSLKEFVKQGDRNISMSVLEITRHLGCLTRINLNSCRTLGSEAFFTLTKNCPLLQSIDMCGTSVGDGEVITGGNLHQNYLMKHLVLSVCLLMTDRALVQIGMVCPNLEFLSIRVCQKITNVGVEELLRVCPKLKHLDVSRSKVTNFVGQSNNERKLELTSIFACNTHIDDEALEAIGSRCPDLEELKIESCCHVTSPGVKKLISKCEKLREINTMASIDFSEWSMNLRPLMMRIMTPSGFDLSKEQRNLFSRNGYYFDTISNEKWSSR